MFLFVLPAFQVSDAAQAMDCGLWAVAVLWLVSGDWAVTML